MHNRYAIAQQAATYIALAIGVLSAGAAEYDVYLLAGQSNMVGFGTNSELPNELKGEQPDVMIFHGQVGNDNQTERGGQGLWASLRPGHGRGFSSDGQRNKYSNRFGVELSFAAKIRELRPGRKIALIKYAKGGTSIAVSSKAGCWDTNFDGGEGPGQGINQYDHCLTTLRNAFAPRDIDGDGEEDQLTPVGILWMQGESDAPTEEIASAYYENLKRLMSHLCAALRVDDLPIAVGLISDSNQGKNGTKMWKFGDIVRDAQRRFAQDHDHVAVIETTDTYGYSDRAHYDSAGYIDLGRQFAEAIATLAQSAN